LINEKPGTTDFTDGTEHELHESTNNTNRKFFELIRIIRLLAAFVFLILVAAKGRAVSSVKSVVPKPLFYKEKL
jgi:hypothetical protein